MAKPVGCYVRSLRAGGRRCYPLHPMLSVYGSRISYYTGKLESYLRFRGIPYALRPTVGNEERIRAGAGAVQMPVVEMEDGRWLSDSTPILAWFDRAEDPARSIYPRDPMLRFIALLIEDYADEWLWRPAMYYRWAFLQSRQYASGVLADELLSHLPIPRPVKRRLLVRRQYGGFVRGDGVNRESRSHVEGTTLAAFARLEAILRERRFVLGDVPTIADFGLMGPMFRHFSQDPTPSELMRSVAPGVFAWVGRMWNVRRGEVSSRLIGEIDSPLAALIAESGRTHLAQLKANAQAFAQGLSRYEQTIEGVRYHRVPVSRYRVWCLEELSRHWRELDPQSRARVSLHLPRGAANLLESGAVERASGVDPEGRAPFHRAINVFGDGIPP
jgi:glutathione S-transferase